VSRLWGMAALAAESTRAAKLGALLSRRRARELNDAGRVFLESGLPAKAERCFGAAVAECDGFAPAWHNFGVATLLLANQAKHEGVGDHTVLRGRALRYFLAALRLRPGFAAAAANASALQLQAQQPEAACETAAHGLLPSASGRPREQVAGDRRGGVLDELVRVLHADALAIARRCVGDEDALRAVSNLATALRMAGRHAAAVSLWRSMLGMAPCGPGTPAVGPESAADRPPVAGAPIPSSRAPARDARPAHVVFVCARWGDKYGPQYLSALARGLGRSKFDWGARPTAPLAAGLPGDAGSATSGTRVRASLVCVTDDVGAALEAASAGESVLSAALSFADLDAAEAACGSVGAARSAEESGPGGTGRGASWPGWWNKARLLGAGASRCLRAAAGVADGQDAVAVFLDLDVVITGCILPVVRRCMDLLEEGSDLVALGTEGMLCEARADGVNSSVMAWILDSNSGRRRSPHAAALDCLSGERCRVAMAVVHRFDHWLEIVFPLPAGDLLASGAAAVSEPSCLRMGRLSCEHGNLVGDFSTLAGASTPARLPPVVVFPLDPKPHRLLELSRSGHELAGRLARQWA